MEIKVATSDNLQDIFDFEKKKQAGSDLSEMELTLKSWDEPWREESLEFYLKTGWCFIAFEGKKIQGYLLAQPQLFMQAATQSLWIESVSGLTNAIEDELIDVAYRWARSKHLQRVLFNDHHIAKERLDGCFPKRKLMPSSFVHSTKTEGA